jgi:uncharacterized protein (DUF362 family)
MAGPTRRTFIKGAAAAGGMLTFPVIGSRALMAEEGPVAMSIARWVTEPGPDTDMQAMAVSLTEKAMETIGGMKRFVNKNDVVWVKPNIGWNRAPELAANTNPDVVGTLVRLCFEAGAKKVKVGDSSCHKAKQTYRRSGIAAAVKAAGGEMVFLDESRCRDYELGGGRLKKWPLFPEIQKADLLINVPVLKHHGLSDASMVMKNYMGIIGGQRNSWHQDLPSCLVDITAYMKPQISVLDAVRVLTANGPQGGNLADVRFGGVVAAATDVVALDALGSEMLGHAPEEISTVRAGAAAGLGTSDYRSLNLRETTLG